LLLISFATQVEQDLTDEELVAFIDEEPADSDSDSDINDEFVEETIKAPSLRDARQQLKGLAVFLADNPQFSGQDEMQLQMLAIKFDFKVSKMTVSRINQSRQQNITAFFSAN